MKILQLHKKKTIYITSCLSNLKKKRKTADVRVD